MGICTCSRAVFTWRTDPVPPPLPVLCLIWSLTHEISLYPHAANRRDELLFHARLPGHLLRRRHRVRDLRARPRRPRGVGARLSAQRRARRRQPRLRPRHRLHRSEAHVDGGAFGHLRARRRRVARTRELSRARARGDGARSLVRHVHDRDRRLPALFLRGRRRARAHEQPEPGGYRRERCLRPRDGGLDHHVGARAVRVLPAHARARARRRARVGDARGAHGGKKGRGRRRFRRRS